MSQGASPTPPSEAPETAGAGPGAAQQPREIDWITPQLTIRALLTGMILGGLLSVCNVYTGLLIGWGTNMSITGILVGFALWQGFSLASARRVKPLTILESNINQSACSAAAAVSSAGLVAPIPALTMLTGKQLSWELLSVWVFAVCLVGISVAIGLRRQMLVVDKLAFPNGLACAQTLKEIYGTGSDAMRRVGMLGLAALIAAAVKVAQIAKWVKAWSIPTSVQGHSAGSLGFQVEPNLLMVGVGGLIGFRAAWSLMLGSVIAWGVLGPAMVNTERAGLTVSEPMAVLPAELAEIDPGLNLSYSEGRRELRQRGVIDETRLATLLALSDDPDYQRVVRKLRTESQLRIAAPLAAVPAGVVLGASDPVSFDAERSELVAQRGLSRGALAALRAKSPDAAWQSAIEALGSWFAYETVRPLRVSERVEGWPDDVQAPAAYAGVMWIERRAGRLYATGPVSDEARQTLLARIDESRRRASNDERAEWKAAVNRLVERSRAMAFPEGFEVPGALAGVVRTGHERGRPVLAATGLLTADDLALLRGLSDDADFLAVASSLHAGTQYGRAVANVPDMLEWLLWPGTALMVISALVAFSFSWRSIGRAFRISKGGDGATQDTGEVRRKWFIFGLLGALVLSVSLQVFLFDIAWLAAVVGVLLSFVLAVVACRVSGETNVTPVGAMGKVTQLIFGVIAPKNAAANLMSANVTGGAASQCADLMHDLKCGYLLGAVARYQVIAQVGGALAGSLLGSAFYMILIPNPREQLMTAEWPAPAVATWKAVAELFTIGFEAIPAGTPMAMLIAAIVGTILPVMDKLAPPKAKPFVPSAAAMGLAFVIPPRNSISMFMGACLALLVARLFPRWSDRFVVTICAGLVAGESLTGAGDALRLMMMGW